MYCKQYMIFYYICYLNPLFLLIFTYKIKTTGHKPGRILLLHDNAAFVVGKNIHL